MTHLQKKEGSAASDNMRYTAKPVAVQSETYCQVLMHRTERVLMETAVVLLFSMYLVCLVVITWTLQALASYSISSRKLLRVEQRPFDRWSNLFKSWSKIHHSIISD